MSTPVDLVVRGGTVVTAGARSAADLGVRDGKIVQIGGELVGAEELDARGLLVLPGGVDMHVHLTPAVVAEGSFGWADDFASGSRAAAAGGITTVGNMTFPLPGEALVAAVERTEPEAAAESIVDFVLHPVLTEATEERIAEIPELAARGHHSIKIFMVLSAFEPTAGAFLTAMAAAGKAGLMTMIHCEDACLVSFLAQRFIAEGRGHPSNYPDARPVYTELVAVARAVAFAEAAQAPIYIVHLSSREALEVAHGARTRGLSVFVETRPEYLYSTREDAERPDGALFAGSPPLRDAADRDALWAALASGDVQTCCTDHAPCMRADKLDQAKDVSNVPNGISELDVMLPMLFSEGVRKGRISLERFVEVTSTNAARLFGIYPRKGTIAVGADADLVVWDPDAEMTISAAASFSRVDYTIYEGRQVKGLPRYTISRGELVYAEGEIVARAGRGQLARRDPLVAVPATAT